MYTNSWAYSKVHRDLLVVVVLTIRIEQKYMNIVVGRQERYVFVWGTTNMTKCLSRDVFLLVSLKRRSIEQIVSINTPVQVNRYIPVSIRYTVSRWRPIKSHTKRIYLDLREIVHSLLSLFSV